MTEIEIKAHVKDPDKIERSIRAFANYNGESIKRDTYLALPRAEETTESMGLAAAMTVFTFVAALVAAISVIAGASKTVAIIVCLFASVFVAASTLLGLNKHHAKKGGSKPLKIRIREENGKTIITYKRKEFQGNVEVNDEREFSIDDRSPFETLVSDIGFVPDSVKEKKTKSWSWTTDDNLEATIELSLVGSLGWFIEIEIILDNPDESETSRATKALYAVLKKCGVDEREIETRYYTEMLAEEELARSHLPKK